MGRPKRTRVCSVPAVRVRRAGHETNTQGSEYGQFTLYPIHDRCCFIKRCMAPDATDNPFINYLHFEVLCLLVMIA